MDAPLLSTSAPSQRRADATQNTHQYTYLRREFELIELLASTEGHVLEREEIYPRLWGYTMVRGDRSVDVFVRKLRQKLERASPRWRYIHTHFGVGYRFAGETLDGAEPLDKSSPLSDSRAKAQLPVDEPELARA
jgi:DNA-binding response OmpR family regulator